jgi:hypothetical protein
MTSKKFFKLLKKANKNCPIKLYGTCFAHKTKKGKKISCFHVVWNQFFKKKRKLRSKHSVIIAEAMGLKGQTLNDLLHAHGETNAKLRKQFLKVCKLKEKPLSPKLQRLRNIRLERKK